MLYEMIGIVRPGRIAEVKEIAKTAGKIVLESGGVVRGFTNWGVFALPRPFRDTSHRSQSQEQTTPSRPALPTSPSTSAIPSDPTNPLPPALATVSPDARTQLTQTAPAVNRHPKHHVGHYFIMRFDSNAKTQHSVRRTMSLDPRLLRYSMVKLGSTLAEIADVGGKAEEWANFEGSEGMRWSEIKSGNRAI